jgi:hypothetical protein
MNGIGFGGAASAEVPVTANKVDNAMDVSFMRPFQGWVK